MVVNYINIWTLWMSFYTVISLIQEQRTGTTSLRWLQRRLVHCSVWLAVAWLPCQNSGKYELLVVFKSRISVLVKVASILSEIYTCTPPAISPCITEVKSVLGTKYLFRGCSGCTMKKLLFICYLFHSLHPLPWLKIFLPKPFVLDSLQFDDFSIR